MSSSTWFARRRRSILSRRNILTVSVSLGILVLIPHGDVAKSVTTRRGTVVVYGSWKSFTEDHVRPTRISEVLPVMTSRLRGHRILRPRGTSSGITSAVENEQLIESSYDERWGNGDDVRFDDQPIWTNDAELHTAPEGPVDFSVDEVGYPNTSPTDRTRPEKAPGNRYESSPAERMSLRRRKLQQLPPSPPSLPALRLHHKSGGFVGSSNNNNNQFGVHGWTPDVYPNPVSDPIQCGITPILFQEEDEESFLYVNMNNRQGTDPLRLCDPDQVLGMINLHRVADSLRNFTNHFGMVASGSGDKPPGSVGGTDNVPRAANAMPPDAGASAIAETLEAPSSDTKAGRSRSKKWTGNGGSGHYNSRLLSTTQSKSISSSIAHVQWADDENADKEDVLLRYQLAKPYLIYPDDDFASFMTTRGAKLAPATIAGGTFGRRSELDIPPVEIAVALARKMNLQAVLRSDAYYSYEDQDDMVNDAAQYFARYLQDAWWRDTDCSEEERGSENGCNDDDDNDSGGVHGILIFLSVQDRVCFISAGSGVASVLPWWRLEHIVSNMKPDLRRRDYGTAILHAVRDLSHMLEVGPPTLADRIGDFTGRFGVVIAFALFTFLFASWGEYRDRRKRWQYAELRSRLNSVEKEKARLLQRQYHTRVCPICLESFDVLGTDGIDKVDKDEDMKDATEEKTKDVDTSKNGSNSKMRRVDSYGIPLTGSDGLPLKMLRCGHIFDESCWKCWINSGQGNPCKCPVCRQDVGAGKGSESTSSSSSPSRRSRRNQSHGESPSENASAFDSTQTTPLTYATTHPNYDSVAQTRATGLGIGSSGRNNNEAWDIGLGEGQHSFPDYEMDEESSTSTPRYNEETAAFMEQSSSLVTESGSFAFTDPEMSPSFNGWFIFEDDEESDGYTGGSED